MSKFIGNMKMAWTRHGSTVTFVAGLAGAIGAGVMGAFGAINAKKIIDEQSAEKERINNNIGKPKFVDGEECEYTKEDAEHDLKIVKRDTIKGVAKALGPSVGLGLSSIGLLTYSHLNNIGKVAGITAYASALEQQVERATNLLSKEVGEDQAKMLMAGYHTEEQVVEKVDEETGEVTQSLETILVKDLDAPGDGILTFTFHKGMWEWTESYERNVAIVKLRLREYQTHMDKYGAVMIKDLMDILEAPSEDRHGYDHVIGNIWEPGKIVEYNILPPLGPDDYDVTFILKTDGIILKKIDKAREEHEKKIALRH